MDMQISNITIIDDNDTAVREQILAKIIAAALLEEVRLYNDTHIHTAQVKKS